MKKKYHVREYSWPDWPTHYGVCLAGKIVKGEDGLILLYPTRAKALACRDYLNGVGMKAATAKRKKD